MIDLDAGRQGAVSLATHLVPPGLFSLLKAAVRRGRVKRYVRTGRIPWSAGYIEYRDQLLSSAVECQELLQAFRANQSLPTGYGFGIDERCIEIPWVLANQPSGPGKLLDAGSALNHGFILRHPALRSKQIDIVTLAPEAENFWRRGVSYLYHDLRTMPLRDDFYDVVTCVSTLEHVGFDNSFYTGGGVTDARNQNDFTLVMGELRRVLRPEGRLLVTVPFGRTEQFGGFQQFDHARLTRSIEAFGPASQVETAFFRYAASGWMRSSADECSGSHYVDWVGRAGGRMPRPPALEQDHAAAARAVACIVLTKSTA